MGHRHRGYQPISEYRFYNDQFDAGMIESPILNANARSKTLSHSGDYTDKQFILGLLAELEGDKEGNYKRGETVKYAIIPSVKDRLVTLEQEYLDLQRSTKLGGKKALKSMPTDLQEYKWTLEAKLHVSLEEVDYLRKLLEKIIAEENAIKAHSVMKDGPIGSSKLVGGICVEMDGAECILVDDTPVINEGGYKGMACSDYIEFIAVPYLKAKEKLENEIIKEIQKLEKAGEPYEHISINRRPLYPSWPKEVQNYLETASVSE